MALTSLDSRISYLEQIIIIIIINGGWTPPGRPGGGGDPFAVDTTRVDALYRAIGGPRGDPWVTDIARLTLQEVEDKANEVAAHVAKLQAHHGELHARLKELRGKQG